MNVLLILARNSSKIEIKLFTRCALFHMKTRVTVKYFGSYRLQNLYFDSKLPKIPSNLIGLTFLVTLRLFTLLYFKIRAIKQQKFLKLALLSNRFRHLFTEVEIWD